MTGQAGPSRRDVLRGFVLTVGAAAAAPVLGLDRAWAQPSAPPDQAEGVLTALARGRDGLLGVSRGSDGRHELIRFAAGARPAAQAMHGVPLTAEVLAVASADDAVYAAGHVTTTTEVEQVEDEDGRSVPFRTLRPSGVIWRSQDGAAWTPVYVSRPGRRERLTSLAAAPGGSLTAVGAEYTDDGAVVTSLSVTGSGLRWQRHEVDLPSADESSLTAVTAWSGGWVAASSGTTAGGLWTSRDGASWEPWTGGEGASGVAIRALDGSTGELMAAGHAYASSQPAVVAVSTGRTRHLPLPREPHDDALPVVQGLAVEEASGSVAYTTTRHPRILRVREN